MKLAGSAGATPEEVEAARQGRMENFKERDRAALEFAERLTRRSRDISRPEFKELTDRFNEGEIVEIAAVAAVFNYFNRFNNALDMEITK